MMKAFCLVPLQIFLWHAEQWATISSAFIHFLRVTVLQAQICSNNPRSNNSTQTQGMFSLPRDQILYHRQTKLSLSVTMLRTHVRIYLKLLEVLRNSTHLGRNTRTIYSEGYKKVPSGCCQRAVYYLYLCRWTWPWGHTSSWCPHSLSRHSRPRSPCHHRISSALGCRFHLRRSGIPPRCTQSQTAALKQK